MRPLGRFSNFAKKTDGNIKKMVMAGIDEAGRGPLAGSVYAAAVALDGSKTISGLRDSKKLSERKRIDLSEEIKNKALGFGIAFCLPEEIDKYNIHVASLMAMTRAFELLTVKVDKVFVDGPYAPDIECLTECVIGGDNKIQEIMAASILAKCARDMEMKKFSKIFPEFGFEMNKGYPTKFHKEALEKHGLSPIHRRTFGPCKALGVDLKKN